MSRELKFRQWQKATQNYIYFALRKGVSLEFNIEPELEQYTGLKDKNGKEIYEGDIIDFFGEKYPVIYRAAGFWAEYSKTQKDHLFLYAIDSEVVGNIHKNPELLEK